jgi:hypothetical protein
VRTYFQTAKKKAKKNQEKPRKRDMHLFLPPLEEKMHVPFSWSFFLVFLGLGFLRGAKDLLGVPADRLRGK